MRLNINGEWQQPESVGNLYELLALLGYLSSESGARHYVVALNQQIINALDYRQTLLADGDCVDVFSAITGG